MIAVIVTLCAACLALAASGDVNIVTKAAGIKTADKDIGGFIAGAKALVDPLLVMVAAISPLVLIAGGGIMLLGGRHGARMIVTALATLLVLGSVTAIIH